MKILQILTILPGGMEWVLIALVVLLLFGGKKIPELMKGLGRGISEFKKGKKGEEKEKTGGECHCCEETYNADQEEDEELDQQEYGHELSNQDAVVSA